MNFLIDMVVENGNNCNHMLAIINEKGSRRNETNNESNTKNSLKLLSILVLGPKIRKDRNEVSSKVVFPPPANQKSILGNKSKFLPNSSLACISFGCNLAGQHIGETKNECLHNLYSTKKV